MNIVITCGHPYSGLQSVHTLLIEAGLAQASVSKREGMSATEFHGRVLSANGVDLAIPASLAPVTPGRVWDDLAVDLFLGNLESPNWGWADSGAVWLLDFWSQFDAQIRFLLVYSSPDLVIREMLRQGALSPDSVPQAIASWVACHTELLRFFHRHRDRCLLVDSTAATAMPQRLVTKAVENLGLDLNPSSVSQTVETPPQSAQSVLEALLVGGLVPRDVDASAIYAELEGTADLSNDRDALLPDLVHAWGEYGQILVSLDQAAKETQRLRETTARLGQEAEVSEAKRAECEAKATAMAAENEIQLLQLHELQVELEQYDLRCQTLEEAEKQRQALETTLAAERAKQSGLANEIKQLQGRVAQGEAAAKQLATAQKEVAEQVAGRKQAEQLLGEAARRTEEISRELIAAKSAHSATETKIREQANAALADERSKQAELAGKIQQLQLKVTEGEAVARQLETAKNKLSEAHGALAGERAKQAELAGKIQQLQLKVTEGEAVAKQLGAAQNELSQAHAALAAERAKQAESADHIQRLKQRVTEGEAIAKQLGAAQKELDGQVAARKQAEQLLAEAARRTEGISRELIAAQAAHSATEETLRRLATNEIALTQESELLRLKSQQDQDELQRCYQTIDEAHQVRQHLEATLTDERAKQAELASEIARLEGQVAQGETAEATLIQENEMLLLQLQQVQDELRQSHIRFSQAQTSAKQLADKQKELDGQIAARKQAEQLLSEAARRTEDLAREIMSAQSAHSATEQALRKEAENRAALTQENDRLLAQLKQSESKTEDLTREIMSAQSAHSATEKALRQEAEKRAALTQENDRLLAQLKQSESNAEDLAREIMSAQSAHSATEKALRQEAEKRAALRQENDLLLEQLKQFENELERTHIEAKKAADLRASVSFPSGVTLKQFTQATVDLRAEISGANWYDAEPDGRWAGPGQTSSLMLPAMAAGQYQLALEVVDAIEPEVLDAMSLSLNGKPLTTKRRRHGSLTVVTATFTSETSAPDEEWKLELAFPRLLSPADRGSDDHRILAVRVRTLSIVPIGTESDWPVASVSRSGKWGGTQPTQIRFDLRGEIDGDNWYDAEEDGRWAGPGHVSSLMLPALGAGHYQMELDVVDAMAPEIVNGMTLSLNGKPIAIKARCHGYPTVVTAEFSTDMPAPDGQWELRISFPRVASPADHGSDDHRTLAIRLRTVSIKEIRPGEDLTALQLGGKRGSTKGSRKSNRWWPHRK